MRKPDRQGGFSVAGRGDGVAAGGGVHEAVVFGRAVQVGDVLLGDERELGMHSWTSRRVVVRAL